MLQLPISTDSDTDEMLKGVQRNVMELKCTTHTEASNTVHLWQTNLKSLFPDKYRSFLSVLVIKTAVTMITAQA